jgi:hypothetical protein
MKSEYANKQSLLYMKYKYANKQSLLYIIKQITFDCTTQITLIKNEKTKNGQAFCQ